MKEYLPRHKLSPALNKDKTSSPERGGELRQSATFRARERGFELWLSISLKEIGSEIRQYVTLRGKVCELRQYVTLWERGCEFRQIQHIEIFKQLSEPRGILTELM